ncbi:MAG: hypothetical protein AAB728_01310 [Patescibacteria group bacterium]
MNTQTLPTPLLAWEAPSLPSPQRSARWYAAAFGLVLLGAVYGIFSHTWSFTLAVVLLGGVYFLLRNARPALHRIGMDEHGFQYDDAFTEWKDCADFWFVALPTHTELHICRKAGWNRETVIQTGPVDPALIRRTIAPYLHERRSQKERALDYLIRILKL